MPFKFFVFCTHAKLTGCLYFSTTLPQGAYAGIFTGAALTSWVFLGSVFYPPNKYPGAISVKDCQFYKTAIYFTTNASAGVNVTAEQYRYYMDILSKYEDGGYIYNAHEPHG